MQIKNVNLWIVKADAKCITTNGTVKSNGLAVMGRGVAKQASIMHEWLPKELGDRLKQHGNHVFVFNRSKTPTVTFPVKHEWHEKASLSLIQRSARELMLIIEAMGWNEVLLPKPGCGNGQRHWDEVFPMLDGILDERVTILDYTDS
jgi:hypothetical protein